jgi:hypothetical protein
MLCLADMLGVAISDWSDIEPKKLADGLRISDTLALKEQQVCTRLLDRMYPQFRPVALQISLRHWTTGESRRSVSSCVRPQAVKWSSITNLLITFWLMF